MEFQPNPTKKVQAEYKTLYIKKELAGKINELANKYNTSFNNIVVSILEKFFESEQ